MTRFAGGLALALLVGGCANNYAHLDWRPGLAPIDFTGFYELSFAEYREFSERGDPLVVFDRFHGLATVDGEGLEAIGGRLGRGSAGPGELAIESLGGDGGVGFIDARGREQQAALDWLAVDDERTLALLVAGPRIAVVAEKSSVAIDAGALVGPTVGGWRLTMVVEEGSPTLFVLPELGPTVAPDEPGWLFEFEPAPAGDEWTVSVARVSVSP